MNTYFLLCHACFHIPALSKITLISGRYSRVIFMHITVNREKEGNASLECLHESLCFAKNHKNSFIGYHYLGICRRNGLCETFRYVYVVKGDWSVLTVLLFKKTSTTTHNTATTSGTAIQRFEFQQIYGN
mgnify:CR=1 FL=1